MAEVRDISTGSQGGIHDGIAIFDWDGLAVEFKSFTSRHCSTLMIHF
jgi:hypothetical protein